MIRILFILALLSTSCSTDTDLKPTEHPTENPVEQATTVDTTNTQNQNTEQTDNFPQIDSKDERKNDQKLDSLLSIVEAAIEEQSVELLLTVMDTTVISSYGGGMYGHQDFRDTWQHDNFKELWPKLNKIISLGGFFVKDSMYSVPYTGNIDEEAGKIDDNNVPHGCGITTNTETLLYLTKECNETESIQVGRTYCMVMPQGIFWGATDDLWKVNLLGTEVTGYVKDEDFYCSADYSLLIEKNDNGEWKITVFAPWD